MVRENLLVGIVALLLAIYAGLFFAMPINLATADLGRHIVNGKLISAGIYEVLFENHYSYTEPDHVFVNHHWGSGVLFHWINEVLGFVGLSLIYILFNLVALGLMAYASSLKSNWQVSVLATIAVVPLVAYRVEVRPEGFSYALLAFYYFILTAFRLNKLGFRSLVIMLLILQILWVNVHIFFFLGIVISAIFLLESLINKRSINTIKKLGVLTIALLLVSLINPHLHKGLMAPFTIFQEYGYIVEENQSIRIMHERFGKTELYHFEFFGLISILSVVFLVFEKRARNSLPEILLVLIFLILAVFAVRGIPLFALFFIPILAKILFQYVEDMNFKARQKVLKITAYCGIVFLLIFIPLKGTYLSARNGYSGVGLIPNINKCGVFIKNNQIPGNIFNNYDFGSYLIYHLSDHGKVFVDNRPEAYSVAFFDSIYQPMQENEDVWRRKKEDYNLNVICFFRLDNTPWAQPFLIRRIEDPEWVPIFVDDVSIIMIKNVEANRKWIEQFALPADMFHSIPNS